MEYSHKCKVCRKTFISHRPQSLFCSGKCRKAFSRLGAKKREELEKVKSPVKELSVEEIAKVKPSKPLKLTKDEFIPNWKRIGLKSKEEAFIHILGSLKGNQKKIMSKGFGNEQSFGIGGYQVTLKRKKKK